MNILILEDDRDQAGEMKEYFSDKFFTTIAFDILEAKKATCNSVDIIISDINIGDNPKAGIDYLKWVKKNFPKTPIIMITGYGNIGLAVEAMKAGAEDFLEKPIDLQKLELILARVLEKGKIERENQFLRNRIRKLEQNAIIGRSEVIEEIRKKLKIASDDGNITVFITGETGTGKELIANSIHKSGRRSGGPFISESLKAKEGELMPGLLFGYEKGAFTDAKSQYVGLLEQAESGVLFLDEIAELDLDTQSRLLRVLETRSFTRLGGTKEIRVDFQLITATSKDISSLVEDNRFQKELFYRLMVFPIHVPPLREHKEDIPELSNYFLSILFKDGRTRATSISREVFDAFQQREWKGNVRELRSYVETAALYANLEASERIELKHFEVFGLVASRKKRSHSISNTVEKQKAEIELQNIEDALKASSGKKGSLYKLLGYSHRDYPRRRIRAIEKKYPKMLRSFPEIKRAFIKKG